MNIEKQKALLEKISGEVAKKHFGGEKLVTGHRKSFYTEAALEFAKQMCELQKIKCSENVFEYPGDVLSTPNICNNDKKTN